MTNDKLEVPVVEVNKVTNKNVPEAIYANQLTSLNRRTEKDPHFFGSVKIKGEWYQLATWINVKDNIQNLSTAYTLMNEEQSKKAEEREQKFQAERLAQANPLDAPKVNEEKEEKVESRKLTREQCDAIGILDTDPLHPDFIPF